MTTDQLVERTLRQLNAGQPVPRTWPDSSIDIGACVMQARQKVARDAMMDSSLRSLLQQPYSLVLGANGEADLTTATGSIAGTILLDGVKMGSVVDADGNVLQFIEHYSDFIRPQPTVYGRYCLKGNVIATHAINVAVNGPNDIQSAASPLAILANFIPDAVDSFRPELEKPLVDALVAIVASKVSPA